MTEYLPKNTYETFFINLSDIERIDNHKLSFLIDNYKYCKEVYYKLSNKMLWETQYGIHTLIYDFVNHIDDILKGDLGRCNDLLIKYMIANKNNDDFNMKEFKKKVSDFENEYLKKIKSLTTTTYIKTLINLFTHKITDNSFIDKINMNNKFLIPLIDCNYNINTKKTEERKGDQNFTKCFNIDRETFKNSKDDEENYKIVDDFFLSIANNNIEKKEYLQKIFGYCITGDINARNFFIFYGEGSNGKSAVIDVFQSLMGQYCKTVEPSNFVNRGNKAGGVASPEMIALDLGTRIGILSEITEEDELNETLLKKISGGDVITYRTLYQKEMKDFVSEAKCIILTNHKPRCSASQSMLDRIRYIDFNARFTSNPTGTEIKRNPELVVKLKNELLPNVLRWCLEGTKKYILDGLIIPLSLQIENDSYGESQNSIQLFLKNKTEEGKNYKVERSDLYNEYKSYCREEEIKKVIKMSEFNKKIISKYGEISRTSDGRYYYGLRIIEIDEKPEEIPINNKSI